MSLLGCIAQAQTSTASAPAAVPTTTASTEESQQKPSAWSGSLTIGRSNSLYNYQDGTEETSNDYSASLGYKLTENWKASALVKYSQDAKNSENDDFAGASLSFSRAGTDVWNKRLKLTPSISLGIPVSKAQKFASLQTSIGAGIRAAVNSDYLFSEKMSLSFGAAVTRNLHTYDTAKSGRVNNQYSSTQRIEAGWAFTEKLSVSALVVHYNTLSYQNTLREFYMHNEEIAYSVNDNWSVALGHQLGGPSFSVWTDSQQDYNFLLTDDSASYVYGSLTYAF